MAGKDDRKAARHVPDCGERFTRGIAAHCAKTLNLSRNRFVDNGVAVYIYDQLSANIENNLFLRNGFDNYTRVIQLNADTSHFAYNTLVENWRDADEIYDRFQGQPPCAGVIPLQELFGTSGTAR